METVALPDRFRVSSHVADGGMATVWAAEDRTLGRTVAIKLLAARFLGDEDAVRRFQREARAAASLSSHLNVVTIFDVGEHEGQPFIVMEYMSGGSLADVLRRGGDPSHGEVLRWLRDAASALDAAHDRGIVHRDVKPGNLLLDERGRLGVTDFGIARVAFDATMTTTGQVMGTAAYLSPEQAEGQPASAASDRYALAVVAYELLAHRRPFDGRTFALQARQHVEVTPQAPSTVASGEIPAAVDPVLLRGLEKDPGARWPTAIEMVNALEDALPEPSAATPPPTEVTQRLPRAPRERSRPAPAPGPAPVPPRPREPVDRGPSPLPPSAPPPMGHDRSGRRWAILAAAALIGALAIVALATLGSDDRGGQRPTTSDRASEPTPRARAKPRSNTAPATASPASPAAAPRVAAPVQDGRSASQLQAAGHQLLTAGTPGDAIPLLEGAVSKCGESIVVDPCAYALYDLGRSLRLAGRPGDAVPILERRLEIPNQQDLVREELDQARREAGQDTGSGDGGR